MYSYPTHSSRNNYGKQEEKRNLLARLLQENSISMEELSLLMDGAAGSCGKYILGNTEYDHYAVTTLSSSSYSFESSSNILFHTLN